MLAALTLAAAMAGCAVNTPDEVSVTPAEDDGDGNLTEGNTTTVDTPDQVTIDAGEGEKNEDADVTTTDPEGNETQYELS